MIGALKDRFERFLGRGDAAVTVPPLDGALKPNSLLEDAIAGVRSVAPDNLVVFDDAPLWSDGLQILRGAGEVWQEVKSTVTAMAVSENGTLAVATQNNGIVILDAKGTDISPTWPTNLMCVTALDFADETSLIACVGSTELSISEWSRDLLENGRSGQLLRLDPHTGSAVLLTPKLGYPNGVLAQDDGSFIVSEAWQKRLIRIDASGKIVAKLLEDLPGYPARISPSSQGGYWLSLFAPRSQLIEFVLREPVYRRAMMAEVDPEFWIAPALRSGHSSHEPMQGGALRQMGMLKPWAPTRSYGLAIELAHDFVPAASFHSRAGGKRHGITSLVEIGGQLWLTSKGGGEVFHVALNRGGQAS